MPKTKQVAKRSVSPIASAKKSKTLVTMEVKLKTKWIPNKKVTNGVTFKACEAFRGEKHVFRCYYKDFFAIGTFTDHECNAIEPSKILQNARDFFWFTVLSKGQRETFKKYKWMESGKVVFEYLPNEPLKKIYL